MERLTLDGNAVNHVEAYLEYKRIVGDDDHGNLMSPEKYDTYKREVALKRLQTRLYVSWANPKQLECYEVGPESICFCKHRFKQHKTDFDPLPATRPINLPCKHCPCSTYRYQPRNARCRCKHTVDEHHFVSEKCQKKGCSCLVFQSPYTCECSYPAHDHHIIVETKVERIERNPNLPVGHPVPYAAMGGLTGFSSLADGYLRKDESGQGKLPKERLHKPINHSDHPLLRHQTAHLENKAGISGNVLVRRHGESDMDYFERQYKSKVKTKMLPSTSATKPRTVAKKND